MSFSFFLCIGAILVSFHCLGKLPVSSDLLKMIVKHFGIVSLSNDKISLIRLSEPGALPFFRADTCFKTPLVMVIGICFLGLLSE